DLLARITEGVLIGGERPADRRPDWSEKPTCYYPSETADWRWPDGWNLKARRAGLFVELPRTMRSGFSENG
ncbi:MAG: hypothetical protein ACTSU0_00550, partial [Alphaproteobacteria bacterium]